MSQLSFWPRSPIVSHRTIGIDFIDQAITSTLPRRTRDPLQPAWRTPVKPSSVFESHLRNDAFQIGTRVDYSPTPVIVVIPTRGVASSSATRACREMSLGVPSRRRMTIPSARRVSRPRILPKQALLGFRCSVRWFRVVVVDLISFPPPVQALCYNTNDARSQRPVPHPVPHPPRQSYYLPSLPRREAINQQSTNFFQDNGVERRTGWRKKQITNLTSNE